MDNSFFPRYSSDTQQPSGRLTGLQIINRIIHWLVGLIWLTEEEKREAGIYLGDQL